MHNINTNINPPHPGAAPLMPHIAQLADRAIRLAVLATLRSAPAYYWSAPASSSGNHHPAYTLCHGGLVRHTAAACRLYQDLLTIAAPADLLAEPGSPPKEHLRTCGLAALILHDVWKSGPAAEGGHTIHEHPLLAAREWRYHARQHPIPDAEIERIAGAIAAHMGQWTRNPRSRIILPYPESPLQKLVHAADYLASRPHITINH